MNKQEAIEKIEKEKSTLNGWEELTRNNALDAALTIVRKLDEPEKPVVPQFVADWYEEHKDNFEDSIQSLCVHGCLPKRQIDTWFDNDDNKPIETLVMMHRFGYQVNKEKLYTAKLKLTNEYLVYESQFNDLLHYKVPDSSAKEVKAYHFTEDDLVRYSIWGNNYYEVEEVK